MRPGVPWLYRHLLDVKTRVWGVGYDRWLGMSAQVFYHSLRDTVGLFPCDYAVFSSDIEPMFPFSIFCRDG